jgi:hypothetical protein
MAVIALALVLPVFWLVRSGITVAGHVQRSWRPALVGGLLLLGGATLAALLLHGDDAPSYERGDRTLRAMLDR